MKITGLNPLIVSKDAKAVIALFKEMGFEETHNISATENNGVEIDTVCLKDGSGFSVDVAQASDIAQDLSLIRMNVDDFDEALAFLKEKGFHNVKGTDETLDTATNKSAMIVSPSGFAFDLCQHIKE